MATNNMSGQVNEPAKKDHSILAFCLGSVAHRAENTRVTREYQKLNPTRYRVKSKVGRTIKVQEKTAVRNFSNALQLLLEQQGVSKAQSKSFNANANTLHIPKAQGSLVETVRSRLNRSARKSPHKKTPNQSAETGKTLAYTNFNDSSLTGGYTSPYENSMRPQTSKKRKRVAKDVSNFTLDTQSRQLNQSNKTNNEKRKIQEQSELINKLERDLTSQQKLKEENEYYKSKIDKLQAELSSFRN